MNGGAVSAPRTLDDAFSYSCKSCGRCCYNKKIQVNPFEIASIGGHVGVSTADVRARYLDSTGVALSQKSDGSCIFLDDGKCGIHGARPLVCRLYPTGIIRQIDGTLSVQNHTPHPRTEGVYGTDGTVREWIRLQKAEEFLKAACEYHALFIELAEFINDKNSQSENEINISELMDMDKTVQEYCQVRDCPEPDDLLERMRLHIEAISRKCGLPDKPIVLEDHWKTSS